MSSLKIHFIFFIDRLIESLPQGFWGGKNPPSPYSQPTILHLITYNIRTLQSNDRIDELEEELSNITWDILSFSETRHSDENCTTLKNGHVLYQNNSHSR